MRALSAGFQMHVGKPVEPAHLVDVVATLRPEIQTRPEIPLGSERT
jgi:hypothetical protein